MSQSGQVVIEEQSQVGEARRRLAALAEELAFSEVDRGRLAIIVTEAAANLIKHGKGGQIVYRALESARPGCPAIELLALDHGNGIADIAQSMRDGYSTAGTAGTGLGAIQRLSDQFEIHSDSTSGTVIFATVSSHRDLYLPSEMPTSTKAMTVGAINVPMPGERECGDRWICHQEPGRALFMVADGLGHGPFAADAAKEAEVIFRQNKDKHPKELLELCHAALRPTRGAAIAIGEINFEKCIIRYSGIGNISGLICPPGDDASRHFVSLGGTVGHAARRFQEFEYEWVPGGILIMYSDGLMSRWRLDTVPGLQTRHPSLIAGFLYNRYARQSDDVTVVVAKQ